MEKVKKSNAGTVTEPSQAVKIFKSELLTSHRRAMTLPELLDRAVEYYPNHVALKFKEEEGSEKWSELTYKEYKDCVDKIAKCFIKLGLKVHESVAILGYNSKEWFISELAAIHAG